MVRGIDVRVLLELMFTSAFIIKHGYCSLRSTGHIPFHDPIGLMREKNRTFWWAPMRFTGSSLMTEVISGGTPREPGDLILPVFGPRIT